MVCPGDSGLGQKLSRKFPEATLHPVPDDSIAHFFCDGVTNPHLRGGILSITDKQNEAAKGSPFSGIGGQKV